MNFRYSIVVYRSNCLDYYNQTLSSSFFETLHLEDEHEALDQLSDQYFRQYKESKDPGYATRDIYFYVNGYEINEEAERPYYKTGEEKACSVHGLQIEDKAIAAANLKIEEYEKAELEKQKKTQEREEKQKKEMELEQFNRLKKKLFPEES